MSNPLIISTILCCPFGENVIFHRLFSSIFLQPRSISGHVVLASLAPCCADGDFSAALGAGYCVLGGDNRFNFSPTVLADFRFPENGFSAERALPHAAYARGGGSHKADDQKSDRPKQQSPKKPCSGTPSFRRCDSRRSYAADDPYNDVFHVLYSSYPPHTIRDRESQHAAGWTMKFLYLDILILLE